MSGDEAWIESFNIDKLRNEKDAEKAFKRCLNVLRTSSKPDTLEKAVETMLEILMALGSVQESKEVVEVLGPYVTALLARAAAGNKPSEAHSVTILKLLEHLTEEGVSEAEAAGIVKIAIAIASSADLPMEEREEGINLLCAMLGRASSAMSKQEELVAYIIDSALNLCCDSSPDKLTADDQQVPRGLGMSLLDAVREHITPATAVFERVMNFAKQSFESKELYQRKGGLLALSVMAESMKRPGDAKKGSKEFEALMTSIFKLARDPEYEVRAAAFYTITSLSRNLELPITHFHEEFFSLALSTVEEKSEHAQYPVAVNKCLEAVGEVIETAYLVQRVPDVEPYLEKLMKQLLTLVAAGQSLEILEGAFFALRHTALAMSHQSPADEQAANAVDREEEEVARDLAEGSGDDTVAAAGAGDEKSGAEEGGKKESTVDSEKDKLKAAFAQFAADLEVDEKAQQKREEERKKLLEAIESKRTAYAEEKGKAFLPFFAETMEKLEPYVKTVDKELFGARAAAMACARGVARAVGPNAFAPHFETTMNLALAGANLEDEGLKQAACHTWLELAGVFGSRLTPHLTAIVPKLVDFLDAKYPITEEQDEDEEDEGDEGEVGLMIHEKKVETQIAALKAVASLLRNLGPAMYPFLKKLVPHLQAHITVQLPLGTQALAVAACRFLPRVLPQKGKYAQGQSVDLDPGARSVLNKLLPSLFQLLTHDDPEVVQEVLIVFQKLFAWAGPVLFAKNLKGIVQLIQDILDFKAPCQMEEAELMEGEGDEDEDEGDDEDEDEDDEDDDDEEHGHSHGKGKGKCTHSHGHGRGGHGHSHGGAGKKRKAKRDEDEDEEDSDEEETPKGAAPAAEEKGDEKDDDGKLGVHDSKEVKYEVLVVAALELITELARAMGSKILPTLKKLLPHVIAKLKKTDPARVAAMGVLADAGEALGQSVAPLLPQLMPHVVEGVQDMKDVGFCRNSCFAAGVLCLKGGDAAFPWYPALLAAITPILKIDLNSEEAKALDEVARQDTADAHPVAGLRDNAASAVSKMILMGPQNLKLDEVVPLFLNALPLVDDFAEAQFVYSSVIKMINLFPKTNPGVIEPHLPRVRAVFEQALAQPGGLPPKVKAFIESSAKAWKGSA